MADFPYIPQVGYPCPVPVLPTVFDESLSYYELLAKLWQQVKELTDLVNAETVDINYLRSKIDEILPYIDDLAHMGERFSALESALRELTDALYDENTGDIVEIRAQLQTLGDNIGVALNYAYQANAVAMRTMQGAGLNMLQENSVQQSVTENGVTFERDPVTGFIHVSGTVTTPQTWYVDIGTYKVRDIWRNLPNDASEYSRGSVAENSRSRFWGLYQTNLQKGYAVTGYDTVTDEMICRQLVTDTTPRNFTYTENTIRFRISFNLQCTECDFWFAPCVFPALLVDWNPNNIDKYPLPLVDANTEDVRQVLSQQIANERYAREQADQHIAGTVSAEILNRESADSDLQALINLKFGQASAAIDAVAGDLTAETEARTNADNGLTSVLLREIQDRQEADGELQEQLTATYSFNLPTAIPNKTDNTDPNNPIQYFDLHELDPGNWYRAQQLSLGRNLPPGFSGGFTCKVEKTVTNSRKRIILIPANQPTAVYMQSQYASGSSTVWSNWYVFTGTEVEP